MNIISGSTNICEEPGHKAEAAAAVNELLAIDPEFAVHVRRYIEPRHYASGLTDHCWKDSA